MNSLIVTVYNLCGATGLLKFSVLFLYMRNVDTVQFLSGSAATQLR